MDKFNNKYRIPSARLQSWDYGANGAYFITICTQNREHLFGEILDTIVSNVQTPNLGVCTMQLNEIGQLAEKYWLEIPTHFPFIELGNFVIMPNHTHGILIINKTDGDGSGVETRLIASLPLQTEKTGGITGNNNPMFHENISRVIRWYKGRCSFEFRKIHADFAWQPRFHDHIIRDAQSFENIQNYITNNPMNWGKDKFYSNNV
jgi:REP element-mobilizing transposase RayT